MYRTAEWAVAYMQHVRFTMSSVYSCTVIRTGPGGAIEYIRTTYVRLLCIVHAIHDCYRYSRIESRMNLPSAGGLLPLSSTSRLRLETQSVKLLLELHRVREELTREHRAFALEHFVLVLLLARQLLCRLELTIDVRVFADELINRIRLRLSAA